jgi:hypothetical protein
LVRERLTLSYGTGTRSKESWRRSFLALELLFVIKSIFDLYINLLNPLVEQISSEEGAYGRL